MSNSNTVAGITQTGTLRNQFPVQTIAAGTEVLLQVATDSGTNVPYYLTLPTGGSVLGAQVDFNVNANPSITARSGREYGLPSGQSNDQFSSSSWSAHPFYVRISGIGTGGTGDSVIVNLRCGSSATFSSNPIIGTTGAAYAAAGAFNWSVESVVLNFWSEYGGRIDGIAEFDGGRYLLDWKTGAHYPYEVALQMAAYLEARIAEYDEEGNLVDIGAAPLAESVDGARVIYLCDDGTFNVVNPFEAVSQADATMAFGACLQLYKINQRIQKGIRDAERINQ